MRVIGVNDVRVIEVYNERKWSEGLYVCDFHLGYLI